MAQFCVYRNPSADSCDTTPLLLEVQSDLLDQLATTVVVPLRPESALPGGRMGTLSTVFHVEGRPYMMVTPQLAGISRRQLGNRVCDLAAHRLEIMAALDLLITGI